MPPAPTIARRSCLRGSSCPYSVRAGMKNAPAAAVPMNVRLVAGTRAQHGLVAVMRGPCVYALDAAANGVRKQNCDLWRIDASRPPRWDKSRRGVVVLAEMLNRQHERRELLFTRYSSDSRDRTFFPALGTEKTVKDELK